MGTVVLICSTGSRNGQVKEQGGEEGGEEAYGVDEQHVGGRGEEGEEGRVLFLQESNRVGRRGGGGAGNLDCLGLSPGDYGRRRLFLHLVCHRPRRLRRPHHRLHRRLHIRLLCRLHLVQLENPQRWHRFCLHLRLRKRLP